MMKTSFFARSPSGKPGGGSSSADVERSTMLTESGNLSDSDNIDIDFAVTETGRTIAHLVLSNEGFDADDDGLDFSIDSSGRTIENIMSDQIMQTGGLHSTDNDIGQNTATSTVPAVTVKASHPLSIPLTATAKSPARAIPQSNNHYQQHQQHSVTSSQPGSHESTGSSFLSGILNPSAAATFNNTQLSHTPPTALGTSYENNHFGKRQRSGSVSGRLRSASDLEEKGLIDRQQKGILKDLIICGDEDLQHALDQYEDGNPAILENMIRSGALQNKAVPDLDLLGDLDLDFLTMNDIGDDGFTGTGDGRDGPGMYTLPQHHKQQQQQQQRPLKSSDDPPGYLKVPPPAQRSASMPGIRPAHSSFPSKQHRATNSSTGMVSPEYDDGIGELEFTGDFGDSEDGGGYYGAENTNDSQHHFVTHPGKQQRAPSPPIAEDKRLRSNSLFSALINDPRSAESHELQYGRWMDRVPNNHNDDLTETADLLHETNPNDKSGAVSQPIPVTNATPTDESTSTTSPTKKKGRRKSDSVAIDRKLQAKLKQEIQEQKRREKQEKREQREREKHEKKEARLQAKAEKKKLKEQKKEAAIMAVDEEEKPVHVPGSGRPRSMSDPNLRSTRDEFGLMEIERPEGWVGAYSPESRKVRIEKFLAKRHQRVWTKTVKYDVRKNFADSRLRVKGRFVKKEDEMLMRDLMGMT